MKINVKFVPHKKHKFTTIGYWFVENDTLNIWISEELSWENRVLVLFHELIESAYCIRKGITTEECDEFDALFEK